MPREEDASEPAVDGADALARRLADVHLGLAHARDELELLAAVVRAIAPYDPVAADLHQIAVDEHGAPTSLRPVALWRPDHPVIVHPLHGKTIRLAAMPLADLWTHDADEPLVVADVDDDPRCDATLRARVAPRRALAVLPLRSSNPDTWQGIVTIHWTAPHAPGPAERLVYRLLMHTLAAFLADRRALAARTAALAEILALHRLSARIGEAADPAELLAAVVEEARVPDAQGKLMTIETDDDGQPRWLTVLAVHGGGAAAGASIGSRIDLAASNTAHMWISQPNGALVIEDLPADPRLDEPSRAVHMRSGVASLIVMPLRWHGRWLGLLQIGWLLPRRIDADERRLYEAIAPQIAAVLDNRLLLAASEQALADNREQARVLEIVLDHLPIGAQIHDSERGERRLNRAGLELLGGTEDERGRLPLFEPDSERPIAPDERLSRMAIAVGERQQRERDLRLPDGTRRRLNVSAAPIRDERGEITGAITLFHDVSARVASERERARLQEAIIAAQRAALAERQAPLIPLDDEVLVLPLIGAIDPERGRQIVETLVRLGDRSGVRVVLIDLTGVRGLDDIGARALTEAARAVRLRGATAMFTGIGGAVAWTLVEQGADLRGLITHTTLAAGLEHAARLLRRA